MTLSCEFYALSWPKWQHWQWSFVVKMKRYFLHFFCGFFLFFLLLSRCPFVDNWFKCKLTLRNLMEMNEHKDKTKWEGKKKTSNPMHASTIYRTLFNIITLRIHYYFFLKCNEPYCLNKFKWEIACEFKWNNESMEKYLSNFLFCDFSSMEIVLNASESLNSMLTQLFEHAQWNWITFIFTSTSTQTYTVVLHPLVSLFPLFVCLFLYWLFDSCRQNIRIIDRHSSAYRYRSNRKHQAEKAHFSLQK